MYAVKQDIINKYDEDTLRYWSSKSHDGVMNDAVIDDALNNASSIMEGYIAKRYNTPLSSVPPLLKPYCVDIAVFELAAGDGLMTDDIKERYSIARKFLKDVASGLFTLGLARKEEEQSTVNTIIFSEAPPRRFKRGL
ncbi:MAG: DUF1320 domain-containing protein [Rhizobiales bacterium]|nr:DUF1320 domain-containing protein [Hyphomicrobiales bacterium]